MSLLSLCPTSSLRSTAPVPSSSHSRPSPIPSSRRLVTGDCDPNDEPHRQEDDNDFLLGLSLSPQGAGEEGEFVPPPSRRPSQSQTRGDSCREETFLETFPVALSPHYPKSLTQADPLQPSSPPRAFDTAGADKEDDAAEFERLMKQGERLRNAELRPIQQPPIVWESLPPDPQPSNDPLDLYFKVADDESDIILEESWTL